MAPGDLTDPALSARAWAEEKDALRAVLDIVGEPICLKDREGRYLHVNRDLCALAGRSEEEIVGKTDEEVLPDALRKPLVELRQQVVRSGKRETVEVSFVFQGQPRAHRISCSPILDSKGRVAGVVGLCQNVSDWKAAQASVESSAERFRTLFDQSPFGLAEFRLAEVDAWMGSLKQGGGDLEACLRRRPEEVLRVLKHLRLIHVNQAMLRLLEAKDAEHFGRELLQIFSSESLETVRKALVAYATGERYFEAEAAYRTFGGAVKSILVTYSVVPGVQAGESHVLVAAADLTDMKRAQREAEARRRETELHRMEILSATGRLAAGVAHEVNNPLQGITAQLRLLSDEVPAAIQHGRRLELITSEVERIARIVRQMLLLHQAPPSCAGRCNVAAVVDQLLELIEPQLQERDIRIEVSVPSCGVIVPMSAPHLRQVLLNLSLNALDAMPNGGTLRIEAERVDDHVAVSVRDTGHGIARENLPRLLTPFFTTKGSEGTGMGLPMVHSLVRAVNGRIDFESDEGCGTTVRLTFPVSPLAADVSDQDA